jgi:endoglycosylceramidase
LHVAWEGYEPIRGVFNSTYIQKIHQIVQMCEKAGIYVILDAHQDLFSNRFCGNGAPDWAAFSKGTFPAPLQVKLRRDSRGIPLREDCLKSFFSFYYFAGDTGAAFQAFYDNKDGIQDHFIQFWERVAREFVNKYKNILGYEPLNEPWCGDHFKDPSLLYDYGKADRVNLMPLYQRVAKAIRKVDNHTIILYEPVVSDITDVIGFETGPGGPEYNDRQAFSYHVYCYLNDKKGDPRSILLCDSMDNILFRWRTENSKRLGGGVFLGEVNFINSWTHHLVWCT